MRRWLLFSMLTTVLPMAAILPTPGVALAHANLVSASIHNNQVFRYGHSPRQIVAKFAEELNPDKSWMAVFEGEADHGLVTENQKSKVSFKHPNMMTLNLPAKLGREKYYLIWYTHSLVDGHYAAGILYFQVK